MTTPNPTSRVWDAIDAERRRDRALKRVAAVAWGATLLFVLVLLVVGGISAAEMIRGAMKGDLPWITVLGTILPVVVPLALLCGIIAALSTIGMFLRSRAATLQEIQVRLAALEEMLSAPRA